MRTKIGITFFGDGNMEIHDVSLAEELRHDYESFIKLAAVKRSKGTARGERSARRYTRAAALALYTSFRLILNRWYDEVMIGRFRVPANERSLEATVAALHEYVRTASDASREEAFSRLKGLVARYENSGGAVLEHLSEAAVKDAAEMMDAYLTYMEETAGLRRFPKGGAASQTLLQKLGVCDEAERKDNKM
ncbi:hypothetical protein [Colibacter massiliensis]|uniref:hypothetical protein n=1 Tax=Colibacter massiliensis TaxID=1852379 RepID=UPI00094E5444|nr:hypothetical protein [Colibacter massiliensis]